MTGFQRRNGTWEFEINGRRKLAKGYRRKTAMMKAVWNHIRSEMQSKGHFKDVDAEFRIRIKTIRRLPQKSIYILKTNENQVKSDENS